MTTSGAHSVPISSPPPDSSLPVTPPTEVSTAKENTDCGASGSSEIPPNSIEVGSALDDYRLEAKLGEGGMGVVFRALHIRLEKHVALKILPSHLTRVPSLVERFQREMKAVGRLDHPNIVRAMDAGEVNGTHYLVMEYVDGTDLSRLVKAHGPSTVIETCEIVRQAALGLADAHAHGLIHRDIKPGNLLLSKQGKVKILDLGLALLQGDAAASERPSLTLTGQQSIMGTPDYMAPEQWENTHTVDGRADLYALGCTLFFLLAGRAPYEDSQHASLTQKMLGHVSHPVPDLQHARADVPDRLSVLYQRLMAKKVEQRLQDPGELAEELEAIIESLKQNARIGQSTPAANSSVEGHDRSPYRTEGTEIREGTRAGEQCDANGLRMTFCWCPAGTFLMGSPHDEPGRRSGEETVMVRLTQGFWMGKFEVTQQEYEAVMGVNPSCFSHGGTGAELVKGLDTRRFPVEMVSWDDAAEFCRRFSGQERQAGRLPEDWEYCLPTEAQWEYACRAGTKTATAFGPGLSSLEANFDGSVPYLSHPGPSLKRTTAIGSFAANPWGIHDMHGNVWEWCRDWFLPKLHGGRDPDFSESKPQSDRVYRGGSWYRDGWICRSGLRFGFEPDLRDNDLGFRVALVRKRKS